jgi:hypothetical protein
MLTRTCLCIAVTVVICLQLPHQALATEFSAKPGVRQNIADFIQDPVKLEKLKKAIRVMQRLPTTDPTSWIFQADIHGVANDTNSSFNQCQHSHWWFLPWHRAYIYYFEKMLQKYSGDAGLMLPYWDYTDSRFRSLPGPFLDKSSPLYVDGRILNGPNVELRTTQTSVANAFKSNRFIGGLEKNGFGGDVVSDLAQFAEIEKSGLLEVSPHNSVHIGVGGLMNDPTTAALDPIFWLHHCNIDRLWASWNDAGNRNPTDDWAAKDMQFFDADGKITKLSTGILSDTKLLGYRYDKLVNVHSEDSPTSSLLASNKGPADRKSIAKSESVLVNDDAVTSQLVLNNPSSSALLAQPLSTENSYQRFLLKIQGVEFNNLPQNTYEIYLNQPKANFLTNGQSKNYVGSMSFFEHSNHAQHQKNRQQIFDVTNAIRSIKAAGDLTAEHLSVTIVPVGPIIDGTPAKPKKTIPLKFSGYELEVVDSSILE